MDGYLVEFDESFGLWHAFFDEEGVEILHIGEAYELVDGGIVANVAFAVGILLAPLACCDSEHCHVEHIGFFGIFVGGLFGCYLGWDEVLLDGIGMDAVVDLGELAFGCPSDLGLLLLVETLDLLYEIEFEGDADGRSELVGYVAMGVCTSVSSSLYGDSDGIGLFDPFCCTQDEAVESGLHSKVVEFDHIKIWVVYDFPCAKKLEGGAIANPVFDDVGCS